MAGKSHDRIDRASLIGMRSGKREIIAILPYERGRNLPIPLKVRCECGNEETTNYTRFRRYPAGCKPCRLQGINRTHGRSGEQLYHIWQGMRHRCGPNASPRVRKHYYEKGIRLSDEWLDYAAFSQWALGNGYEPGLSIDRISPAFGYSPDNCEWVTRNENNRRTHRHRTFPMGTIMRAVPPRALLLALNGGG